MESRPCPGCCDYRLELGLSSLLSFSLTKHTRRALAHPFKFWSSGYNVGSTEKYIPPYYPTPFEIYLTLPLLTILVIFASNFLKMRFLSLVSISRLIHQQAFPRAVFSIFPPGFQCLCPLLSRGASLPHMSCNMAKFLHPCRDHGPISSCMPSS